MKKRIMGIVLLSTLLLSACSNGKDKEAETANSKVEQLDSRVTELESSSSSEEIESKYSKDEIKTYLNKDYNNEYTKEFINKAYDEGILLFYNGQLGVYEADKNSEELSDYGPKSFMIGFSTTETQTDTPDYWVYKYDNDEFFSNAKLAFENPDGYSNQNPDGPFFAKPVGKSQVFNESNKTELLATESSDDKQQNIIEIFNSFK